MSSKMQLSANESAAYDALRGNGLTIFRTTDLSTLMRLSRPNAYNLLRALKKKGAITAIKNGLYAFKDVSEYAIGAHINWPSYLSFRSALSYYGLTDNAPRKMLFAATRYNGGTGDYKYVVLSKKRFFGYVSAGDVVMADMEKAIIDSLLLPKYSGGIAEIRQCIENGLESMDINKLVDYAIRMESMAVSRRLGFLLQEIGISDKKVKKLRMNLGSGYERLDPTQERSNNLNKTWLLDINTK